MAFFQFPAHYTRQRADFGVINICHAESSRIQLIAGSHRTDHRDSQFLGSHDDLQFGGHRIHGVHDIVVLFKRKLIGIFRKKKAVVDIHLYIGIDLLHAVAHHLCLIFSHRFSGGNDLPVQIGQADLIIINQIKASNAAAHKRLADIAADSANAEHCHSCLLQFLHGLFSQQKLCPRKLI